MEEWKMALDAAEDIVTTRVQRTMRLLESNSDQLQKISERLVGCSERLQPHQSSPKRPDPRFQRRSNTDLGVGRRSVPNSAQTPKSQTTRPSLPAPKTLYLKSKERKPVGTSSKPTTPTKQKPQLPVSKPPIPIPVIRPKPKLRKEPEAMSALSTSEFNGTAFLDTEDFREVSGVSPIPGRETPSKASVDDDIELIQRDLARLS